MRILIAIGTLLAPVLLNSAFGDGQNSDSAAQTNVQQHIVDRQRAFYNEQFKDIQFVFFEGGEEWIDDLSTLGILLGHRPRNLCYEHPPDLRQELLDVSVTHLGHMLRNQEPYAALFKADTPLGWRENVCTISLNPLAVSADDKVATSYMFDLEPTQAARLPPDKQLPVQQFLHYLIDHEAYHCLDAYYNGPQPMSFEELWGEFYNFRRENGSDVYALAMNMKRQGKLGAFPLAIQAYRGMSIFHGDPDHWTYDAIEHLLALPVDELKAMTTQDLFSLATKIRNDISGNYEEYLNYRAAAMAAMRQLNATAADKALPAIPAGIDHHLVERLINISSSIQEANAHLAN